MSYHGRYSPKNVEKYAGDASSVTYRSLWERQVMRWLDENPNVVKWNSEEVVIPYLCETDNKVHRYFMDFFVEFGSGDTFLIEVKPEKQTKVPRKRNTTSGKQSRRFLSESLTYVKNQSKWRAATQYCAKKGWTFAIWTEKTLAQLGIKVVTKK